MFFIKKYAVVASGIVVSRIFGFIRELLMASILGTGPVADAFNVAFRFPNTFRRIFAEGALSSSFVSLFSREIEKSKDHAKKFSEEVLNFLFFTLLIFTIFMQLFMPFFVFHFIAPGFFNNSEKFSLTIRLSIIMFPYLSCMSLTAIMGGILNCLHRYFISAIVPVILNIILITILFIAWIFQLTTWNTGLILAWGVTTSGIVQFLILWIVVHKSGIKIFFRIPYYTSNVFRLFMFSIPAVISGGITQINLLINTNIASSKPGGVSSLVYADRLYQLPLGVIGIAAATILLPELSKTLRNFNIKITNNLQNRSIEFVLLLIFPISVILITMPEPIVRFLFEHGKFNASSTKIVSDILSIYGFGLPAFILIKVILPFFFIREDTKTPMKLAIISAFVNIFFVIILFPIFSIKGIAISEIISGWLNTFLLFFLLVKKKYLVFDFQLVKCTLKFLFSSIIMFLILLYSSEYFSSVFSKNSSFKIQFLSLFLLISGALIFYFGLISIMEKNIFKTIKKS